MMKSTRLVKISISLGILLLLTFITYISLQRQTQKQLTNGKNIPTTITQEQTAINKINGNNSVAKTYAQQLKNDADRMQLGLVQQVDIQLTPEDISNTNIAAYKNSITFVKTSITVDGAVWENLVENQRQNVVTTFSKTLRISPNTSEGFTLLNTSGQIIATGHQ